MPRLHRVDVPVLDGLVVGRVVAEGQRHLAEGVQAAVGVGTGPENERLRDFILFDFVFFSCT